MFAEPTLDRTEQVLGVFFGGRNQWGGKVIVTDQRLLFAELNVGSIPDLIEFVGGEAGVPGVDVGMKVLDQIRSSVKKDVWLVHVAVVEPEGMAGWFAPPKVRVTTSTGEVFSVGIVKSITTPNKDPGNNAIRDRAVAIIRHAMNEAKAAAS
jgi:hypothetical protein